VVGAVGGAVGGVGGVVGGGVGAVGGVGKNLQQAHQSVGISMINQRTPNAMTATPMTAAELRRRMEKAKLSSAQLGALIGKHQTSIDRMLAGESSIHFLVGFAVRKL